MTRNVIVGLTLVLLAGATAATEEPKTGLSRTDALLARAQKICPVSGKKLTSMGGPVKVEMGGRTLFVCCQGCVGRSVHKGAWDRITANLIQAQGSCPVRGNPLPNNPAWVVVNKRLIFVCCKPCIARIKTEPTRYLRVVDSMLQQNLDASQK